MSEIIRELFRGNLETLDRPFDAMSPENIAFNQMETLTEEMEAKIPEEYHPLLERYKTAMMSLMDAACEEEYLSGYRLGVRMMVAAWQENDGKASS